MKQDANAVPRDQHHQASPLGRRRFVTAAGAVCAGVVSGMGPAGAMAKTTAAFAANAGLPLDAGRFRACLGEEFQLRSLSNDGLPVTLTLQHVRLSPFQTAAQAKKESAFSIDLTGATTPMPQDTYAVSHPQLGEFIALLVPTEDGRTLVGVFNTIA